MLIYQILVFDQLVMIITKFVFCPATSIKGMKQIGSRGEDKRSERRTRLGSNC